MLDHVSLPVSDLAASRAFYEDALRPLGYELAMELPGVCGFAADGRQDFWIVSHAAPAAVHVAFGSPDRATVDAFHAAALAAGGRDNGGPGVREVYHPTYYGAYVLDPDGHNIEAVCHRPG